MGWYAVGSSVYDLVYAFGLSWNASSFILILFIWAFSILFLVDSSKRFVDFIYLWNENNLRNQSPVLFHWYFSYCLLYFFLIYFCCNLGFFPSSDLCVFFFSGPPGIEFVEWDLSSSVTGIYYHELPACPFWTLVGFALLCFHLICAHVPITVPPWISFLSHLLTVCHLVCTCELSDFPSCYQSVPFISLWLEKDI